MKKEGHKKLTRIGPRNLKTALAVFICMVISKLIMLEYPFFVIIAAIISMENSLANSFKAGKSRMLGTFIGAGIGMACALIRPGSAALVGIGMIVVIYLCNLFKWRKSVPIAGIVFIAVMVSLQGKNPILYSFNRILDTFIGIMVAVAVNYFVFPPDYLSKISRIIPELVFKTKQMIENLLMKQEKVCIDEYEKEVVKANNLLELVCADIKIRKPKNAMDIPEIQKKLQQLTRICRHLRIISQISPTTGLNETNAREIQNIFGWKDLPRQTNQEEADIVLNYHIHEVLALYQSITDCHV